MNVKIKGKLCLYKLLTSGVKEHALYSFLHLFPNARSVRQCLLLDSDRNKILCTDGPMKNGSRAGICMVLAFST